MKGWEHIQLITRVYEQQRLLMRPFAGHVHRNGLSLRWCGQIGKNELPARSDRMCLKEAGIHFKRKPIGSSGRICRATFRHSCFARHHSKNGTDNTTRVDERDVQRNSSTVHPETGIRCLRRSVNEKHAGLRRKVAAFHQAKSSLLRCHCELHSHTNRILT